MRMERHLPTSRKARDGRRRIFVATVSTGDADASLRVGVLHAAHRQVEARFRFDDRFWCAKQTLNSLQIETDMTKTLIAAAVALFAFNVYAADAASAPAKAASKAAAKAAAPAASKAAPAAKAASK